MKITFQTVLAIACLAFFFFGCKADAQKPAYGAPVVPDALKTDPAKDKLAFYLKAEGFQIYECRKDTADPAGKNKWFLKEPTAKLFDDKGQLVGEHAKGPVWKSILKNDNSNVTGILPGGKPKGKADAPSTGAIPWLLIDAKGEGTGMFSKITKIQRLDTNGGKAPEGCCDATGCCTEVRVPYTATYYFYTPK